MNELINLLSKKPILLHDQGCLGKKNYLMPFVLTDIYTTLSGMKAQPTIHFWQLEQAMILGMKDTRVPQLEKGISSLLTNQYQPIIRNAGGLGVIADTGILNVSLILPNSYTDKISIDQAYQFMWQWIQASFQDNAHQINAFEISNSYCPGSFDLSINGRKFAGIAQRRIKQGIAIMIYLSINGDQERRGKIVRDFYHTSLGKEFGTNGYPAVSPESMANLGELLEKKLTLTEAKMMLLQVLTDNASVTFFPKQKQETISQSNWFKTEYAYQLKKMNDRNKVLNFD